MAIRIGIDIGSTHTDAVAIENKRILLARKTMTTQDLTTGLLNALSEIITELHEKEEINAIMIGTTHGLNALHQGKSLNRVCVIRIGLPAGEGLPPAVDWEEYLKSYIPYIYMVRGGHEYTGEEIVDLDENKISRIAEEIFGKVDAIAISSIFSIVNPEHELRAEKILRKKGIDLPIILSHKIGGLGLIERENSTILNALILGIFERLISIIKSLLNKFNINAKLYFAQNDGTIASEDFIRYFPIFTVAGPVSNSIRGAHLLTGIKDAIVMDVGGTTTNVGALSNGYPRESGVAIDIVGIRTNFMMPDIYTLALGGGTIIKEEQIGPESIGYNLIKNGIAWGGDILTATDISIITKEIKIEGAKPELVLKRLNKVYIDKIYNLMVKKWEDAIDTMKTSKENVPVIVVGGGSIMIPEKLNGASEVIRPEYAQFANAIGSTLTKAGATIERTFSYDTINRNDAIKELITEAQKIAINSGAKPNTIEIREIEELQMPYLPGNSVKVRVKVVGDLNI
jgi:N-methylhydantoinase A/oxoprolinase/acetone carboxylase beta subunit